MATGFFCIGADWRTTEALDEFGPGTLDGIVADGPSFDGCACAAQENACAAIERRPISYANMGRIRRDMIENGEWTQPATVSNPRTGGATPAHIVWEVARLNWGHGTYTVPIWLDEQPATLTPQQIREAIHYETAIILMVFQAHNLSGNEQNVFRHYVTIAGYGGDAGTPGQSGGTDANGYGMVYLLNSDIAGQHGAAQGQWMWIDDVLKADPRAWVVMAHVMPVPPPPPPQLDIPGAVKLIEATVSGLQVAVTVLQQALAKLGV